MEKERFMFVAFPLLWRGIESEVMMLGVKSCNGQPDALSVLNNLPTVYSALVQLRFSSANPAAWFYCGYNPFHRRIAAEISLSRLLLIYKWHQDLFETRFY